MLAYHHGKISSLRPSAPTAATDQFTNRLMFFTEFHFTPAGVFEIGQKFNAALGARELEAFLDWNDACSAFRIRCIPGDSKEVSHTFMAVLLRYIKDEIVAPKLEENDEDDEDDEEDDEDDELWDIEEAFDPDQRLSSTKIQRLATWQKDTMNGNSDIPDSDLDTLDISAPKSKSGPAPTSTLPKEFDMLKHKEIWSCADEELNLEDIFTNEIVHELKRLTGCQIVKDASRSRILIGSNLQEDCDQALLKLDTIRKYYSRKGCYINHLFYTENIEHAEFTLKFFRDISKRYFKTTILDNLHVMINKGLSDNQNLFEAVRVRLAPYNEKISCYIPMAEDYTTPALIVTEPGLRNWDNFKYCAHGKSSECPAFNYFSSGVPSNAPREIREDPRIKARQKKNQAILLWSKNIPKITGLSLGVSPCAAPPVRNATTQVGKSIPEPKLQRPSWDTYVEFGEAALSKGDFKDAGTGGVFAPQTSTQLASSVAVLGLRSIATPLTQSKLPVNQPVAPRSKPLQSNSDQTTSEANLHSEASVMSHLAPLQPKKLPPHLQVAFPSLQTPLTPQRPASSPLNRLQSNMPQNVASSLVSPSSPSMSKDAGLGLQSTNGCLINLSDALSVEQNLLDDDTFQQNCTFATLQPTPLQPSKPIDERQQNEDEVLSRIFHSTMNQMAPKGRNFPTNRLAGRLEVPEPVPSRNKSPNKTESLADSTIVDALPDFVDDVTKAFSDMVTTLRGFRGQLEVRIDFGRIILRHVHPKLMSNKGGDKVNTHDAAFLRYLFFNPTNRGPTCHFTSVLTTVTGEIPHVLAMKSKSGELLWAQQTEGWNVILEFTFRDKAAPSATYFTVEIDGENFQVCIKKKSELGNVYIHGTKRHNDIRIAAAGSESSRALEEKYGHLATALEKSLWIPPNKPKPDIYWVLDHALVEQFDCEDLTVRRVCHFSSPDRKLVLHLSELQALDVAGAWAAGNSACVFYGIAGSQDRKPYQKLSSWNEVSISSRQVDETLKANNKLELGEEAAWTAETISDAAWSMCAPACEMLQQMDSIGWQGENGIPLQITMKNAELRKGASAAPIQGEHYW